MTRVVRLMTGTLASMLLAAAACSPAAPPPPPPPPAPTAKPAPTATAEPKAEPKAEVKKKTLKPELPNIAGQARPAAPAGLDKVHKMLAEKNWQGARTDLEANIQTHRRKGTLDVKVQAYAMLGLAMAQLDEAREADRAYRRVVTYASRPDKQIQKETQDAKEVEKRLATVMHGIGEALFHLAEKKRARAEAKALPAYDDTGDPKKIKKHADRKVKNWMRQRSRAIERARDEYLKVADLKPVSGPWVVAGASRVGAMWADAAYECIEASLPDTFTQNGDSSIPKPTDGAAKPAETKAADAGAAAPPEPAMYTWKEIRAVYEGAVGEVCAPLLEQAKEAYGKCQEHATSYGDKSAFAKSCESWIANAP